MGKKKGFFQKMDNQRAVFIALWVSLIVFVTQLVSVAIQWTLSDLGFKDERSGIVIGSAVGAIILLSFLFMFRNLLED
jgi:hypothetical protein